MAYLLIPLDDAIVFPGVTATLPIDVGDEERVFLISRAATASSAASASSPR